MNKLSRISIITPSYNQARYIGETIESVLSQEGDFEIEYFVMDGGSTDGSVNIIKNYAEQVNNGKWPLKCSSVSMKWISHRDNGQSDAINQGFKLATGDIVSWINSDDTYINGAFSCVVERFTQHPEVDFIYGDGEVIDEKGDLQWEWLSRPYNLGLLTSYHFLWNEFTNYIMQQATFWKRPVFNVIGYLDESFHYGMDIEYWIRAGKKGLKLHHIPQKLGRFRFIAGTKSLSSPTIFWEDHLEIVRRYRGSYQMGKYFAFYYYNFAKEYDYDLKKMAELKGNILERWRDIPYMEQCIIEQKANYGYKLGCFLIANELLKNDNVEQARLFARGGLSKTTVFHPFAWPYIVRKLIGLKYYIKLGRWWHILIQAYRRKRYDYRYYEKCK